MALLTSMIPTVAEFTKWMKSAHPKGNPAFKPKDYRFTGFRNETVHNTSAHLYPNQLNTVNAEDVDREIVRAFSEYLKTHLYAPIMNNPGNNYNKLIRYYERAYNYCKNYRKKQPEMLPKGWHGFEADSKPKRGAHLSSSWVTGAHQSSENFITLKLGKKEYKYGVENLHKFLNCYSVGQTVAQLSKMPAGSVVNGLKKLYGHTRKGHGTYWSLK